MRFVNDTPKEYEYRNYITPFDRKTQELIINMMNSNENHHINEEE